MGHFSDIVEANSEAHDPWSSLHSPPLTTIAGRVPAQGIAAIRLFPCASCASLFASDASLKQHLFDEHRTERFYLRINGRPAIDLTILNEPLASVVVIPLGTRTVEVSVSRDGHSMGTLSAVAGIDTEVMPETIQSGLVTLKVRSAETSRSYSIYVQEAPTFDATELDGEVRAAQEPLDRALRPNWRALMAQTHERNPNSLEGRYLAGFTEYLLSADLDIDAKRTDSGRALERAWGYLRPFGSRLARSTVAILAFRFDAYDFLTTLTPTSSLASVAGYLMSPPKTIEGPAITADSWGIWVDDFQEALINASALSIAGRYTDARDALHAAPDALRGAPGNDRKRLILAARIASALGDMPGTRAAYSALRSDPEYAVEAEANLR